MARKVLECRSMFPESRCTMLFVGEEDEVMKAFHAHAAGEHESADTATAVDRLQAAVFVGGDRAYLGDLFTTDGTDGASILGPGFVLTRFQASSSITVTCKCIGGSGSCNFTATGPVAICNTLGCTGDCTMSVDIPTPGAGDVPETVVAEDWLFKADAQS